MQTFDTFSYSSRLFMDTKIFDFWFHFAVLFSITFLSFSSFRKQNQISIFCQENWILNLTKTMKRIRYRILAKYWKWKQQTLTSLLSIITVTVEDGEKSSSKRDLNPGPQVYGASGWAPTAVETSYNYYTDWQSQIC